MIGAAGVGKTAYFLYPKSSLVQEVIVKAKDDIEFIFKNGFEVRV